MANPRSLASSRTCRGVSLKLIRSVSNSSIAVKCAAAIALSFSSSVPLTETIAIERSMRASGSCSLQHGGDALADADAHAHQGVALVLSAELECAGAGQPNTAGPERMSQSNGPTVRIDARLVAPIDAQVIHTRNRLAGECLIELDDLHVVDGESCALQRLARSRDRPQAHLIWAYTCHRRANHAREWLEAEIAGPFGRGDQQHGGAVVDTRAVAGRDAPVFGEGRPELGQRLHGRIGARMLVLRHFDQLCFTRWHRRRNDLLGQAPVL